MHDETNPERHNLPGASLHSDIGSALQGRVALASGSSGESFRASTIPNISTTPYSNSNSRTKSERDLAHYLATSNARRSVQTQSLNREPIQHRGSHSHSLEKILNHDSHPPLLHSLTRESVNHPAADAWPARSGPTPSTRQSGPTITQGPLPPLSLTQISSPRLRPDASSPHLPFRGGEVHLDNVLGLQHYVTPAELTDPVTMSGNAALFGSIPPFKDMGSGAHALHVNASAGTSASPLNNQTHLGIYSHSPRFLLSSPLPGARHHFSSTQETGQKNAFRTKI
ncbi:hypothetical protein B0H10DRAFT_2235440 [Mycena sp. CBHHK59/15]|nr:hypothetical protein B0H10DRAFT_2235440 [Mycena sp. CBHHK59/15]